MSRSRQHIEIITTHISADFDGLASMIAASKLYPDALLTFSGAQERNVRDFISQNLLYRYDFPRAKDLDLARVRRLILVDTRSSQRIGPLATCLENPDLELILYDHHLQNPGDLKGNQEFIADYGSTTTLLVEQIQQRGIELNPMEATLLALGIYEDTGSLTHLTTTPADLRAAAWLLERGAKLDQVSQFLRHELTSSQINILHELIKNARKYTIQDIPVVVVTYSSPDYIDEFALIARRFMAMEDLDVLFVLLSMAGRLYLIARSRIADVNVGNIARDFDGGGHASAASATIRDMTLIEAEEKLIHLLHRHIRPQPIASEMMSKPAITITPDATIREAHALLTRYNVTAVPVRLAQHIVQTDAVEDHGIVGIISRQVVEKATHHSLEQRPVADFMTTEVKTLPLNATLADIQELIIEHRQRLIPIVQNRALIGVITRTDLLNRLVNDPAHLPKNLLHESELPSLERTRNLSSLLVEWFDKEMIQLLQTIGGVAKRLGYNVFAVGGFVRDLLLKKENDDLDVVVEGDGIALAKELAAELGGRYRTHERFKTAVVLMNNGFKIDVATARLEYYEYPAAMPTVELSSIKLDLFRRDFTINAMAIQLNPEHFGTLIDFFNCQNDLKQKLIKVLHNLSFVEDPSRIFRAIRFEKRMGFQLAPHTRRLITSAVNMGLFGKTEDLRFLSELKIIFNEKDPIPPILRLAEFNLFQFLWPELNAQYKNDRRLLHNLHQARETISWFRLLYLDETCRRWMVYLLTMTAPAGSDELRSFCTRFKETPNHTDLLVEQKQLAEESLHQLSRDTNAPPSRVVALCEELTIEGLLYTMAIARKKSVKKMVSLYITNYRYVDALITGRELVKLGYKPGPQFKTMLTFLRNSRLDGRSQTREDELALLKRHHPVP